MPDSLAPGLSPPGLSPPGLSPAELLNRAIDLDRAGQTARAHAVMRGVADSLPDWDEPKARLAESFRRSGKRTEAVAAYRSVLALNPNRESALLALGALLIEAGAPAEATGPLLRCCGIAPGNRDAWSTLACACADAGRPEHALAALVRAQQLQPRSIALAQQLASAALTAGQGIREVARQQALSERDPLNPAFHIARGLILDRLGLLPAAIDALEAAVALAPGKLEPIRILAGVLARTARAKQAEAVLRQAVELDPQNPQLLNDHAAVLMRLHRHGEAVTLLREVLDRNGPHASVICNLANATVCLGLQDEAVALARKAIALDPEAVLPRRALANTLPYQDGVTGAVLLRAARDCAEKLPRGSLGAPIKIPGRDRTLTVGLLSGTLRTHPVGWLTVAGFEHLDPHAFRLICLSRAPEPADPIAMRFQTAARVRSFEVGSASNVNRTREHDARSFEVGSASNVNRTLEHDARSFEVGSASNVNRTLEHDARSFEVGSGTLEHDARSFEVDPASNANRTLEHDAGERDWVKLNQSRARPWEDVSLLDDAALALRARELGVDIIIDLGGHGDAARMAACARRLAPVQIKWVGMQNHSSGLPEMDWFLTDRWETPPALEALYSERMLRMPDGYVCYSPPPHAPDVVVSPALRNGPVTFGCFNNIAKITPRVIETWCEILHAVPRSRLILKTHQLSDAPTARRLRDAFDIEPSRLEIRGSSPHRAFLASYNEIDIVLDPFPYSGGLTTCEALWMGVPTVTLPGEIFASRHSLSHLSNAGFPDWAARDRQHYIELAISWARNIEGLAALREVTRARVRASPLCDAPRFGRALGLALRHAWNAI